MRRARLRMRQGYIALLLRLMFIAIVGFISFSQLFYITQIKGLDMFPELKDGDLAIVFRMQREYAKNDVVAYQTPDGVRFGRIVALENDTIDMNDTGIWQVNATVQGEAILYPTYAQEGIAYPYNIPEDSVFIMGDYRTQCIDSRSYGPIALKNVIGKLITIMRRRKF